MAQRQHSASLVSLAVVMALLLRSGVTEAATYVVGDNAGWTYNLSDWSNQKIFRAGDTLVFNYVPSLHNVVEVDLHGYVTCTVPSGSKVFFNGSDHVKLTRGPNFFICSFPGQCASGMKLEAPAMAA